MYFSIFTHRDTPLYIKGLVAAALIYLISPFDFIPDWFAGLGIIDDIAIVSLLLGYAIRLVNKINESRDKDIKKDTDDN